MPFFEIDVGSVCLIRFLFGIVKPWNHTTLKKLSYLIDIFKGSPGSNRQLQAKIQQTKVLVMCQRFGDLFLFGLIWQYTSNHKTYNKVRIKVIASYLQQ